MPRKRFPKFYDGKTFSERLTAHHFYFQRDWGILSHEIGYLLDANPSYTPPKEYTKALNRQKSEKEDHPRPVLRVVK